MDKVILLAEDSTDDVAIFKRTLAKAGVVSKIHVVQDGRQTVAYLNGEGIYADRKEFPLPHVLFLDLLLPGMDGWEVLKWIQTKTELRDRLVVFVLAGVINRQRLQEAYQLGAKSFILKPLSEEELKGLIRYWPAVWDFKEGFSPLPRSD